MPQITWKNIGDLDFSDSNDLRTKGSEMIQQGAQAITDVFKEVATKNAVIEKEDRDNKMASVAQGMALAQNEDQLRKAYIAGLNVHGIGADNVLKLTDNFTRQKANLIQTQGNRLRNTGTGLDNIRKGQENKFRSLTQGKQVEATNRQFQSVLNNSDLGDQAQQTQDRYTINTGKFKTDATNSTNKYTSILNDTKVNFGLPQSDVSTQISNNQTQVNKDLLTNRQIDAQINVGLPEVQATADAAALGAATTENNIKKEIAQRTKADRINAEENRFSTDYINSATDNIVADKTRDQRKDTLINQANANVTTSAIQARTAGQVAQNEVNKQLAQTKRLEAEANQATAKASAFDKNYYLNQAKFKDTQLKQQQALQQAKINGEKAKASDIQRKIDKENIKSIAFQETMLKVSQKGSKGETIDPVVSLREFTKKIKDKGLTITPAESSEILKQISASSKVLVTNSPLNKTPYEKFTKDTLVKDHLDNLPSEGVALYNAVFNQLAGTNTVLVDGKYEKVPAKNHKNFMKDLVKFLDENRKFTPIKTDDTEQQELYDKFVRQRFSKTRKETKSKIK